MNLIVDYDKLEDVGKEISEEEIKLENSLTNIEKILMELKDCWKGKDSEQFISNATEYIQNETGYDIPPMTPFVGENFNLTRAGIHADGMMKDPEIYNIFDTETILARPPKVSINNASGLAGVAYWVNEYRAKHGESELPKKDALIQKIYDWVTSEYESGRITVISDRELIDRYTEYSAS